MLKFLEQQSRIVYYYQSLLSPTIVLGGFVIGLSVLLSSSGQTLWAMCAVCFSIWGASIVYDRSEFAFEASTRQVIGWRKSFRKTEIFKIPFAEISGVIVEAVRGGPTTYRITLSTADGFVPLVRTYQSKVTIIQDGIRIHAWLKRHGVDVLFNDDEVYRR